MALAQRRDERVAQIGVGLLRGRGGSTASLTDASTADRCAVRRARIALEPASDALALERVRHVLDGDEQADDAASVAKRADRHALLHSSEARSRDPTAGTAS